MQSDSETRGEAACGGRDVVWDLTTWTTMHARSRASRFEFHMVRVRVLVGDLL